MIDRPSTGYILFNTAMLWLATVIAASALWPVYQSRAFLVLVAVALPLGSLIAILGAVFRWPGFVVMLVSIAAFLAVGVPLAVPSQAQFGVLPTFAGLVDLLAGTALGWKQLLTITLPVGSYEALLVPALVLILLVSVVGLSVALRAKRRELAVLAPVVLFLVATAFGPTFPDRPLVTTIALLVVLLFWLVWFRWYRRRRAIRLLVSQSAIDSGTTTTPETGGAGLRTVVAAAVIMAVASAAAVGSAAALPPSQDRTVLRTTVVQPFDPRDYVSPLSAFRRYWQPANANAVLFEVSGLRAGERIRLATLDSYNGVVYSVGSDVVSSESGSFTRVPYRFDQSAVEGDQLSLRVTVDAYSGVWLPTVGQFESIEFSGAGSSALRQAFFYNNVSGTAAIIGGLASGDTYDITSVVPAQPSASELATLTPGSAIVPTPSGVPEELTAKLDEYTSEVDGAGNRLVAMLAGLAQDGYISHGVGVDEPSSRSGHAADRIAELLTAPRMIGDAEQYAVTAALMANDLGFPARVVMGFVPKTDAVVGRDVSAWIEVNTVKYGWVTIDPTPPARPIPDEVPQDTNQVARPPTIVPPPVVDLERIDRQTTPDSEQELPADLDPVLQALLFVLRVVGWIALGAAIVVAPFLVIIAAKVRRRRLRRRGPTVIAKISGGWQEFEDAVVDHGLSPAASATRSEVAAIAGGTQSQVLAAVADRAIFSPDDPQTTDAEAVWRAVDELRVTLDDGLTRWQRFKARISLRSLGGYSVRNLFKR
jgi:transglutaminase-like putative cysteine protease